jgi:hypothetical protein
MLIVGSAAVADQELADASTEASPSSAVSKAASSPEAIPRSITAAAPEKQAVTNTTTASTTSAMSKTASLPEELLGSISSSVPSPTAAAQEKQAGTGTSAASGVTEAATAVPATTTLPESVTFPFGHEEFPLILDMSREEQLPISEVDSNIWQITTTYDPPDENVPAGISSYLFRDVDSVAAFAVSEVVDGDVPDMRQGPLFSSVHVGGTEKHDEASSGSTAPTVAITADPTVAPVQLSPVEVTSMAAEVPGKMSVSSDPDSALQGERNSKWE